MMTLFKGGSLNWINIPYFESYCKRQMKLNDLWEFLRPCKWTLGTHLEPFSLYWSHMSWDTFDFIYCSLKRLAQKLTSGQKQLGRFSRAVAQKEFFPPIKPFKKTRQECFNRSHEKVVSVYRREPPISFGECGFPDPVNPGNPTHCPQDMKDMTIASTPLLVSCWGRGPPLSCCLS